MAIYKDRVEIYNPGAFPEGYDPQDFIDKAERPIRRNPKIARILYYSKDIESFGTGLKRIADACETANVRYEFRKMKSGFVVCFYRAAEKNSKSTDKVRIKIDELNPNQIKIIEFLLDEKKITNKDVQQLLGVKESRALKIIREMVNIGVITKRGKLKSSYYILNEIEE